MTDAVVETERPRATAAASAWYDRVAAIVPIATVYFWLCILYAWESRGHKTPWVFGDELKMAQISRPLARRSSKENSEGSVFKSQCWMGMVASFCLRGQGLSTG